MKTYEVKNQTVKIDDNLKGKILDVGGGGEGIIGRAFGESVIAIDKRQDELDEAPCQCQKLVMDAANLEFDDKCFDTVTSFFTMMYIGKKQHKKVLQEIYRVLKKDGEFVLWDAIIPENKFGYEVFIIHLSVQLQDEAISTGYGVSYDSQNEKHYSELLNEAGFTINKCKVTNSAFKIIATKE